MVGQTQNYKSLFNQSYLFLWLVVQFCDPFWRGLGTRPMLRRGAAPELSKMAAVRDPPTAATLLACSGRLAGETSGELPKSRPRGCPKPKRLGSPLSEVRVAALWWPFIISLRGKPQRSPIERLTKICAAIAAGWYDTHKMAEQIRTYQKHAIASPGFQMPDEWPMALN